MKSFFTALLTGLLASLALFWLMQAMIMPDLQSVKKTENLHSVEFIRLKREPPPPKVKPKPPEQKSKPPEQVQPVSSKKAPTPKKQPPIKRPAPAKVHPKTPPQKPVLERPELDLAAPTKESSSPQISAPQANAGSSSPAKAKTANSPGVDTGISSNVVALVRIPPKYPRRAASRRIEGWVKIEFTITTTGTVKDAIVVEAKPSDVFNKVALEAISKWKFKERIADGVPVEQRAVQVLQFKLSK